MNVIKRKNRFPPCRGEYSCGHTCGGKSGSCLGRPFCLLSCLPWHMPLCLPPSGNRPRNPPGEIQRSDRPSVGRESRAIKRAAVDCAAAGGRMPLPEAGKRARSSEWVSRGAGNRVRLSGPQWRSCIISKTHGSALVAQNRGLGGWRLGGRRAWGWTSKLAEPAQQRLPHPATKAMAVGRKQCGRSQ